MTTDPYLERLFPNLSASGYKVTSPRNSLYNCIGWAAEETDFWWWPSEDPDCYWPVNVPSNETLENFALAFEGLGYETCADGELEKGFLKIALYADAQGTPTHAARQLMSGAWTSKLGELQDIEHSSLRDLECDAYGKAVMFLRKPQS